MKNQTDKIIEALKRKFPYAYSLYPTDMIRWIVENLETIKSTIKK